MLWTGAKKIGSIWESAGGVRLTLAWDQSGTRRSDPHFLAEDPFDHHQELALFCFVISQVKFFLLHSKFSRIAVSLQSVAHLFLDAESLRLLATQSNKKEKCQRLNIRIEWFTLRVVLTTSPVLQDKISSLSLFCCFVHWSIYSLIARILGTSSLNRSKQHILSLSTSLKVALTLDGLRHIVRIIIRAWSMWDRTEQLRLFKVA